QRADLLRYRLEQPEVADQVMDALIAANDHSFRAYLARARYLRPLNQLDKAARDIEQALALKVDRPQDRAEILVAAADLALAQGRLEQARQWIDQGLVFDETNAALYRTLAGLEVRAGKRAAAIACLRRGLDKLPNATDLMILLADLLIDEAALPEAEGLIAQL